LYVFEEKQVKLVGTVLGALAVGSSVPLDNSEKLNAVNGRDGQI